MMDLWATVPYYTAYLSRALLAAGVPVQIGSITYYLDRDTFRARGLRLDPGVSDLVGRFHLPKPLRRVLKLAEGILNLAALTLRFLLRPPAVVHVQYLPMLQSRLPIDGWFLRFCQRRGSRIVLTVHDLMPHDTADRHKQVFAHLYNTVDALICHSPHIQDRLQREFAIPPAKIAVIPHGPFFYDLPEGDATSTLAALNVAPVQQMILWQGIIFPYKGVDLLLNAWRDVEAQSADLTLVVLGTGDPALTASLEQQARDLGLQRVRFHFRFCSAEELVAAYRAASVVVYPYRAITTSGALATGLALGKPIVASNLPVFRELLTDGIDALLVDPQVPEHLSSALLTLSRDPQLRRQFADTLLARGFGAKSWAEIAASTRDFYISVLNRTTPTQP
jgi:glycosyltransferase involved in cell wall biosynthesis